jgi:hydroxypyruvate isomerase
LEFWQALTGNGVDYGALFVFSLVIGYLIKKDKSTPTDLVNARQAGDRDAESRCAEQIARLTEEQRSDVARLEREIQLLHHTVEVLLDLVPVDRMTEAMKALYRRDLRGVE